MPKNINIFWYLLKLLRSPRLAKSVKERSYVHPSVCLSRPFLTFLGHAAHTQRDSPGGSTAAL